MWTSRSRWCAGNHRGVMLKWQKKLNFVAAILDFWRAFLNQFWPNLVHTYKIHFWISFVLCVVFKCQYFWSYSRKTHFWPFIYIFQRAINSLENCLTNHMCKLYIFFKFFFFEITELFPFVGYFCLFEWPLCIMKLETSNFNTKCIKWLSIFHWVIALFYIQDAVIFRA